MKVPNMACMFFVGLGEPVTGFHASWVRLALHFGTTVIIDALPDQVCVFYV